MVHPVNLLSTVIVGVVFGTYSAANTVLDLGQKIGGDTVLRCWSAPKHKGLTRLTWTKQYNDTFSTPIASVPVTPTKPGESLQLLPLEVKPVNGTTRVTAMLEDGSLQITNAVVGDSGTYMCQGYIDSPIEGGEILVFTDLTNLTVGNVPDKPPGKPELEVVDAYSLKVKWQQSTVQDGDTSPVTKYTILVRNTTMYTWEKAIKKVVNTTVSAVISRLRPYTRYMVSVQALNIIGMSERSDPSEPQRTLEAAPEGKPQMKLGVKNFTKTIYLELVAPDPLLLNGNLMGYYLLYGVRGAHKTVARSLPANITSVTITALNPFTIYNIKLRYFNSQGVGPWAEVRATTLEGVPDQPWITNVRNQTHNSLQVVWQRPHTINGILTGYKLSYHHNGTTQYNDYVVNDHTAVVMRTITNLDPFTKYGFQVAAHTRAGQGPYSDVHPGYTDVEGPSDPVTVNLTAGDSNSITVSWSIPLVYFVHIDQYRVKYWRNDTSEDKATMMIPVVNMDTNRNEAVIKQLETNYLYTVQVAGATKSLFVETNPQYILGKFSEPKTFTLKGIYITTQSPFFTSEHPTFGYIAGTMATVVIIIIGIVMFIVTRRCLRTRYQFLPGKADRNNMAPNANNISLPEAYIVDEQQSVSVEKWTAHVAKLHADTNLGFSQEYEEVNNKTCADLTAKHSTAAENEHKNRYLNIVAYDNSRVVLKPLSGTSRHTDYINANHIDGYKKPRAYIATQGPLTCVTTDFWRMIWEQRTAIIMMITKLTERGRRKCDQYWPSEAEHTYGHFTVRLASVQVTAQYTVRVFGLRHCREKGTSILRKSLVERTVTQYHYTEWPDHGVPTYTLPVLKFVRKSMAANPDDAGPIVLHCSAGVGRTGTCIVIDAMIKQIQDKGSIDVIGFLMHIRNQRNYLVQTEDQYVFIHDALLEYIRSGDTEVSSSEIGLFLETLKRTNAAQGDTLLQRLYKLVSTFKPDKYDLSSALMKVNASKNRSKHILPVESSQVRLPAKPGVEGSDYINATHLMGYNKNNEFIITQHPLAATTDDFWRMVWDQNSMTIVLLSVFDDECTEFWPKGEESMDGGHFKVTSLTEESSHESYTTRDFLLQSTQDDYECTTSIIAVSNWPDSCAPLSSVFDLVRNVKNRHRELEGPVIVVDKYGGTAAAKFCGLVMLHDQLMQSDMVDPYMTAKLYHLERPGVFPTHEDFLFLYEAIASICDEKHLLNLTMGSGKDPVIIENTHPDSMTRSLSRISNTVHETPM